MARSDPAEFAGSDRQAARERAFRLLAITVSALFIAFATLGGAFVWYDRSTNWVTHTHQVRSGIADVLQSLTDAESAQRGYILTGEGAFLVRLDAASARAKARMGELEGLTHDNLSQQTRLNRLRDRMEARIRIIDHTVTLRRGGDAVAAIRAVRGGEGVRAMDDVRQVVNELDMEELRLEAVRADKVRVVRGVMILALVIFGGLLAFLFIKAVRDIELDREVEADTTERLRLLLADRTLLLDKVNHRVKNSLQQIASVVRLQSRSVEHPGAKEALEKTLDRIMAVGRVHEQLYDAGGDIGVFDAGAYAAALARDLVTSMGRDDIELVTDVQAAALDLRQAVPLALILNELVTNALKYGCPAHRRCKIRVGFGTDGDDYRLSVSDDGDGLPKGFTPRAKKSLGMRAIEALARQLGGRFVVEQPETGAAFAVVFPRS